MEISLSVEISQNCIFITILLFRHANKCIYWHMLDEYALICINYTFSVLNRFRKFFYS